MARSPRPLVLALAMALAAATAAASLPAPSSEEQGMPTVVRHDAVGESEVHVWGGDSVVTDTPAPSSEEQRVPTVSLDGWVSGSKFGPVV